MKKIGIVICNYNKKDRVLDCIQSVLESKADDFDLYVVDNASTDGSADAVRRKYGGRLELIVNRENLGGSGGFNTGLRRAFEMGYPYLMCLDNDVLVDEDAVGELYDFLEAHPEVGMAGSKVYQMEDPDVVQQFGIAIDFDRYCVESKYLNCPEDGTMPEVVYSDSVAACSLMVRSSVIRKIGFLPEENFLYWDDTEWGYLCNLAGYKVASFGRSQVLHAMGAKKEEENTFPTYYAWRNWIGFFMKYTPERKWKDMTAALLGSVFDIVFESMYNGRRNKMKTVLFAYDDAIHQVRGKASADKIFPLERPGRKLTGLIRGKNRVCILDRSNRRWGEELFGTIRALNPDAVRVGPEEDCDLRFTFCSSVFRVWDFSLKTVYIDLYGNIFATKEDADRIGAYRACREAFIDAHQPLFLYRIRKVREP